MHTIFTIGHSKRELAEFIELLRRHRVGLVVDVRKMPRSRSNPQFNGPDLKVSLEACGISYVHLESLTGFRGKAKLPVTNAWDNKSFQSYAAYMGSDDFSSGIEELIHLAEDKVPAVMCSEAVWWRCHRRMIADALVVRELDVRHILSTSEPQAHELTKFAKVVGNKVEYPDIPGKVPTTEPKKPTRGAPKKASPPAKKKREVKSRKDVM